LGLVVLGLIGLWLGLQPALTFSRASAELEVAMEPGSDRGTLAERVQQMEQLASQLPQEPLLWRRLARGYLLLGRPEEAMRALEMAYRLAPASLLIQQEIAALGRLINEQDATLWQGLGYRHE
jgi:cytochrome c-type biogenesis protein CcmH/NrfG